MPFFLIFFFRLTASGDGTVRLWDVNACDKKQVTLISLPVSLSLCLSSSLSLTLCLVLSLSLPLSISLSLSLSLMRRVTRSGRRSSTPRTLLRMLAYADVCCRMLAYADERAALVYAKNITR